MWALVLAVLGPRHYLLDRRPVAGQLVRHRDARLLGRAIDRPVPGRLGRFFVAPLLHRDVQHHPVRIHRPPAGMGLA